MAAGAALTSTVVEAFSTCKARFDVTVWFNGTHMPVNSTRLNPGAETESPYDPTGRFSNLNCPDDVERAALSIPVASFLAEIEAPGPSPRRIVNYAGYVPLVDCAMARAV
jgi:hypothetical protein